MPKAGAVSEVRGDIGSEAPLPSDRSEPEPDVEEDEEEGGEGEAAFEDVPL